VSVLEMLLLTELLVSDQTSLNTSLPSLSILICAGYGASVITTLHLSRTTLAILVWCFSSMVCAVVSSSSMLRASWEQRSLSTIVVEVQERRVVCRQEMVAGRAVSRRAGPVVMKWSHSLAQSEWGRMVDQPDCRRGQNRVLEVTENEERWEMRDGHSEERRDHAREKNIGGEG